MKKVMGLNPGYLLKSSLLYYRSTLTDSEQFWNDRFDEALDTWRESGILDDNEKPSDDVDATVNFDPTAKINVYPDETANESILQTASFVEEHLKSLCKLEWVIRSQLTL